MIFLEPAFLVFGLSTIVLAQVSPRGLAPVWLGLGVNLIFMLLFLGATQTVILLGFTLAGFAMQRFVKLRMRGGLFVSLATMLGMFVVLKQYDFVPLVFKLEALPAIVGLSYVLFRLLHLIVDYGPGTGASLGLVHHFQYTLNCHALVSGPFQRLDEYQLALQEARRPEPLPVLARMMDGFIKVVILAQVLKNLHSDLLPHTTGSIGFVVTVAAALAWVVFMYFNFSGYMDIVISWAKLCRFNLPENFDRPLQANSFLEFWSRWHMTMTLWFKSYVFNPLMIFFGRHFAITRHAVLSASGLAFFVTFLLVGAWHGPTLSFLTCGVLLGIGATVNQISREILRQRKRGKPAVSNSGYLSANVISAYCAALTFIYIAIAVSPFWLEVGAFIKFLVALSDPINLLVMLPLCCTVSAIGIFILRQLTSLTERITKPARKHLETPIAIAVRIICVILFLLTATDAFSDFIYKGI